MAIDEETPILRGAEGQAGEDPPAPVYVTGTIVYYDSLNKTQTSSSSQYEVGSTFTDTAPSWPHYTVTPTSFSFTVTGAFTVTYTYEIIKVYCTQNVYYDEVFTLSTLEGPLQAGATFTPDHSSHIPDASDGVDTTHYEFDYCDSPGQMTCPDTNFTVNYYFKKVKVDGTIALYYDEVWQSETIELFEINNSYNISDYIPSYDDKRYKFDYAKIDNTSYDENDSFICPNENFTLEYYFVKKCQAYIYATKNGVTKWWPATVYIYKNSSNGWVEAQPYIYNNNEWS